jgi:hypothetical protein
MLKTHEELFKGEYGTHNEVEPFVGSIQRTGNCTYYVQSDETLGLFVIPHNMDINKKHLHLQVQGSATLGGARGWTGKVNNLQITYV